MTQIIINCLAGILFIVTSIELRKIRKILKHQREARNVNENEQKEKSCHSDEPNGNCTLNACEHGNCDYWY